jgi:hypothetical protein
MRPEGTPSPGYEAPRLVVLGTVAELTQISCGKKVGGTDFVIFQGSHLVCSSG